MNRFFGSFSSFLFFVLIFIILLPLILIQFSINHITIKKLQENIDQRLTFYGSTFIESFKDECRRCEEEIYFAKRYLFKNGTYKKEEIGSYFFSSERPFSRISLLDSRGGCIFSLLANPDQTYFTPKPYEEFRDMPPIDSSSLRNFSDTTLFPLQLLPDRSGFVQRIIYKLASEQFILIDVSLYKLVTNSVKKTNLPMNSFLILFDKQNDIIYNNTDFIKSEEALRIKEREHKVSDYTIQNRIFRIQKFDVDAILCIGKSLEKVSLIIGIDYTAMISGIKSGITRGFLLTTGFGLLVCILFLFTGFYIKNNTTKILNRTKEIAVGEFDKKISIRFPNEFGAIADNINELSRKLKILTQERLKSAKLSAIGRFAAHMVHDLRNPVYGLSLITSELRNLIKKDDPRYKYFNEIAIGIERLGEIIERIADHGRIYEPRLERVDINKLIRDVADEFEKANPCKIDLQLGEVGILMIDPAQWRRVFLNLFQNSYEAKKDDCHITIKTISIPSSLKGEGKGEGKTNLNPSVYIEISDKSGGIPEEILDKIFEPFTTTKKKGLGLGLSFVREIVEVHNGEIKIENKPGIGVKFIITLPRSITNEVR
ncbi:MAG: HAMP domain-containing sensor histidine kinase [candidate division WOR-3 bacterium]